jgi:uncharacterized metal-binding protein YceD (DUF177 family)
MPDRRPSAPEFPRPVPLSEIGEQKRLHQIEAGPRERESLCRRFGLLSLTSLSAELDVRREAAGIRVKGSVRAVAVQPCGLSGEAVPADIEEPVNVLFAPPAPEAPAAQKLDEEVELDAGDLDVLPLEGNLVDLGELAAQTFGLALDPYPRAPDALTEEERRLLVSEDEDARASRAARNPFAVLKKPPEGRS